MKILSPCGCEFEINLPYYNKDLKYELDQRWVKCINLCNLHKQILREEIYDKANESIKEA